MIRRPATCSQASVRAFSHGCVRVDQPFKLAEDLLRPERGWTEARLRKMVGKNERRVSLPAPVPIHIVYFTMAEDEYGRMAALRGHLRLFRQGARIAGPEALTPPPQKPP